MADADLSDGAVVVPYEITYMSMTPSTTVEFEHPEITFSFYPNQSAC
jgi:hypothetical protein